MSSWLVLFYIAAAIAFLLIIAKLIEVRSKRNHQTGKGVLGNNIYVQEVRYGNLFAWISRFLIFTMLISIGMYFLLDSSTWLIVLIIAFLLSRGLGIVKLIFTNYKRQ